LAGRQSGSFVWPPIYLYTIFAPLLPVSADIWAAPLMMIMMNWNEGGLSARGAHITPLPASQCGSIIIINHRPKRVGARRSSASAAAAAAPKQHFGSSLLRAGRALGLNYQTLAHWHSDGRREETRRPGRRKHGAKLALIGPSAGRPSLRDFRSPRSSLNI